MTGTRKDDLASRLQVASSRSSASATPDTASPRVATAPRSKPVRLSVDLAPTAYRRLTEFCHSSADALGMARVTSVDVIRALLAELNQDTQLAERVRTRIADQ